MSTVLNEYTYIHTYVDLTSENTQTQKETYPGRGEGANCPVGNVCRPGKCHGETSGGIAADPRQFLRVTWVNIQMATGALPQPEHVCGTGCLPGSSMRHHNLSYVEFRPKLKSDTSIRRPGARRSVNF